MSEFIKGIGLIILVGAMIIISAAIGYIWLKNNNLNKDLDNLQKSSNNIKTTTDQLPNLFTVINSLNSESPRITDRLTKLENTVNDANKKITEYISQTDFITLFNNVRKNSNDIENIPIKLNDNSSYIISINREFASSFPLFSYNDQYFSLPLFNNSYVNPFNGNEIDIPRPSALFDYINIPKFSSNGYNLEFKRSFKFQLKLNITGTSSTFSLENLFVGVINTNNNTLTSATKIKTISPIIEIVLNNNDFPFEISTSPLSLPQLEFATENYFLLFEITDQIQDITPQGSMDITVWVDNPDS